MAISMVGRVLNGRYKITERIGIGGMAEVYIAQDTVLGRIVAIKIMLPQFAEDKTFTARFRQEAASAANLQSPYIVNIYDWGQDQGTYFIVMEFIHGSDLKTGIKERGVINQRKVAEIGVQVCQALTVAHNMDITHSDIKPQNIMVQPDGNIKVMDFGIACAKNTMLSQTSSVLGTAHYISPEQAQGKDIGPASDIYSLGVVLYEAATGSLPFDGPDAISVALKQVNEQPVPPRRINPRIDPILESIILKAMAKDPRERFGTAGEMRQALNDFLLGKTANGLHGFDASETQVLGSAARGVAASAAASRMAANGHTAVMPGGISDPQMRGRHNPGNTGAMQAARPVNATNARGGGVRPVNAHQSTDMYGSGRVNNHAQAPQKKSKKGLVIGIVIGVIAIIAAVFLALNFFGGSTIPDVEGKTITQAENVLKKAGYTIGKTTEEFHAEIPAQCVIKTNPEAGKKAEQGTKVDIVVSKGPELVTVPSVLGMTNTEAIATIETAGFKAVAGDPQYSTEYKEDTVMSQTPAAKSQAAKGSNIVYQLSKGTESVTVPYVVGKTQDEGTAKLSEAGFTAVIMSDYNDEYDAGVIFEQSPSSGKQNKGSSITIYVSKGQDLATVPNVSNRTVAEVVSDLIGRGFTNVEKEKPNSDSSECTDITNSSYSSVTGRSIPKSTRLIVRS